MTDVQERDGHRLVEKRSPSGHAVYLVPEKYADASVSDCIRELAREGLSRAEISRMTGIRYQHVRNVLEQDEQLRNITASTPGQDRGKGIEIDDVGSHLAFADLVARVERGEEILIHRAGSPIVRLVAVARAPADDPVAAACRRMDALAEEATLGDLTIRGLIDEGRRH